MQFWGEAEIFSDWQKNDFKIISDDSPIGDMWNGSSEWFLTNPLILVIMQMLILFFAQKNVTQTATQLKSLPSEAYYHLF